MKLVDISWTSVYNLKVCHSRYVYILRINKNTIRQYTTPYYNKSKVATCFGCTRHPSSGRIFQNCKNENYIAVDIHMTVKPRGRDFAVVFVNVMSRKHFYNVQRGIVKAIIG